MTELPASSSSLHPHPAPTGLDPSPARADRHVDAELTRAAALWLATGDLVSAIVHEMRNPVQSMLFAAEALRDGAGGSAGENLLEVVGRSGDRVADALTILDDLLSTPTFEEGPISLREIIPRVIERQRASRRQIDGQLRLTLPAELPAVRGRPDDLQHVLGLMIVAAKATIGAYERGTIDCAVTNTDTDVVITVHATAEVPREAPPEVGVYLSAARALMALHDIPVDTSTPTPATLSSRIAVPVWIGERDRSD